MLFTGQVFYRKEKIFPRLARIKYVIAHTKKHSKTPKTARNKDKINNISQVNDCENYNYTKICGG